MIYGSVCSGIEAASVAWEPLGWRPAFFSEIEPFPRAVLAHHYPGVPLHGDFTTIKAGQYGAIDLLVGGTPCQSFSLAGLRRGLADDRGNLALEYLRLADRLRPRWVVWENVPGVLSSGGGRDFGSFLGALVELGYGFAYRVIDAQYCGVAQRRRRVFVVGHLGDWRRAAAVLFERESLSGHPPPRREAGEGTARRAPGGARGRRKDLSPITFAWQAGDGQTTLGYDPDSDTSMTLVANQVPAVAFTCKDYGQDAGDIAPTLRAMSQTGGYASGGGQVAVAFGIGSDAIASAVRRLTPREAERLQGFPDDWTLVPYRGKPAADGPRYRAIGNSMAVPVMRWIGERIQMVEGRFGGD